MKTYLKLLLIGVLFGVSVFIMVSMDKSAMLNTLNQYNLLPKPKSFTELYFEDHLNLTKPVNPIVGKTFRFTVRNLERRPFTYNYSVKAISTQSATLVDRGKFTLQPDESTTILQRIATTEAFIRTRVSVTLENKDQSIHFWVN